MSPLHFHPSSETYKQHPEWCCHPIGDGLLAYNTAEPGVELERGRDRHLGPGRAPAHRGAAHATRSRTGASATSSSTSWRGSTARARATSTTFREALLAMLDRLQAKYPDVTFQIDETNDYRLFPYESVARGPSWFQNGSPEYRPAPAQPLEPEPVRAGVVARPALPRRRARGSGTRSATLMAAALPSHLTFFSDLRRLPDAVIDEARPWLDLYKRRRELFTQHDLPAARRPARAGLDRASVVGPGARRRRAARLPPAGRARVRQRSRCGTCPPGGGSSCSAGPNEEPVGHASRRSSCARGSTVDAAARRTPPRCC